MKPVDPRDLCRDTASMLGDIDVPDEAWDQVVGDLNSLPLQQLPYYRAFLVQRSQDTLVQGPQWRSQSTEPPSWRHGESSVRPGTSVGPVGRHAATAGSAAVAGWRPRDFPCFPSHHAEVESSRTLHIHDALYVRRPAKF